MPTIDAPNGARRDFDRTHAFVTSWVYQLPNLAQNRFAKVIVNGWEVNGIWSMYSGSPLTFALSQDRALRGQPNRPDRIEDPRLDIGRSRNDLISQYFDRTAFVPNQTGQFGNAPRAEGQLQAPGTFDVTAGVQKRWRGIRESDRIQFRTELFNAASIVELRRAWSESGHHGSYGRITSASDGRIIQFGLKYVF